MRPHRTLRHGPTSSRRFARTPSIFSYVYNSGEILLDPTVPIEDLNAQIHVPILSFYHSFNFFSRSANVAVAVPYGYGHFRGRVLGDDTRITRSGLADSRIRVSVNLLGGPAMTVPEFVKHRERLIIGASVTVVVPVGQYDPARLINPGANRWAAKPEIGVRSTNGALGVRCIRRYVDVQYEFEVLPGHQCARTEGHAVPRVPSGLLPAAEDVGIVRFQLLGERQYGSEWR